MIFIVAKDVGNDLSLSCKCVPCQSVAEDTKGKAFAIVFVEASSRDVAEQMLPHMAKAVMEALSPILSPDETSEKIRIDPTSPEVN